MKKNQRKGTKAKFTFSWNFWSIIKWPSSLFWEIIFFIWIRIVGRNWKDFFSSFFLESKIREAYCFISCALWIYFSLLFILKKMKKFLVAFLKAKFRVLFVANNKLFNSTTKKNWYTLTSYCIFKIYSRT